MTKYLTCTETAKMVRKILKEAYPMIKFSVRSSTYSMGASIHIEYWGGPTEKEIEDLVGILQGASFDGMTDCKSYHACYIDGELVRSGADFIFINRKFTAAMLKPIADEVCARWQIESAEIINCASGAYASHYDWGIIRRIGNEKRNASYSQALPSITRARITLEIPSTN